MTSSRSGKTGRTATQALAAIGAGAALLYGSRVLLDFFGPSLPYSMKQGSESSLDSDRFLHFLSVVTDGTVRRSRITRLKDGIEFYPAELEAVRNARHSINLEFYEFHPGEIGDALLAALAERARAGVEVRVVVDALGSFGTPSGFFEPLRAAGGQMRWYHPVRWDTWQKANNRTHRKLLLVDGLIGFIGGAGVADRWQRAVGGVPAWRDTMFRVEGEGVAGLVSTFSENWLESAGEILAGAAQFESVPTPDGVRSFVVSSTPHGGGTQARILFQALIKSARESIRITTPYFLPDRSARRALIEAVRDRGVKVEVLTAGPRIDHPLIRRLSRRSSRRLLEAGAAIFEYQPAMIHAKLMTIDAWWSVVGSTNFDHRSFALNDEVNLAVLDPELALVLDRDFEEDLKQSCELNVAMLRERTLFRRGERVVDDVLDWES